MKHAVCILIINVVDLVIIINLKIKKYFFKFYIDLKKNVIVV